MLGFIRDKQHKHLFYQIYFRIFEIFKRNSGMPHYGMCMGKAVKIFLTAFLGVAQHEHSLIGASP